MFPVMHARVQQSLVRRPAAKLCQRQVQASQLNSTSGAADAVVQQPSKAWDQQYIRKWRESYTLASFYKTNDDGTRISPFPQTDHERRRRENDLKEICEAGRKLGLKDADIRANLESMESLLPDFKPNLHKMKASNWAKLSADVNKVAHTLILLKMLYPTANVSMIIRSNPKILFMSPDQLQLDAAKVKAMLVTAPNIDSIVEAVPDLLNPASLTTSLANLKAWFPDQDPVAVLQKNPKLLLNIGEADLEADPCYGEENPFIMLGPHKGDRHPEVLLQLPVEMLAPIPLPEAALKETGAHADAAADSMHPAGHVPGQKLRQIPCIQQAR